MPLSLGAGMTKLQTKHEAPVFWALEIALEYVRAVRRPLEMIRRRSPKLAAQIERAVAAVPANVAEGNRRRGRDRIHFFRIAAGSADETRVHLQTGEALGYVTDADISRALQLADRELGLLWGLTRL